jgi:hypothetical protein
MDVPKKNCGVSEKESCIPLPVKKCAPVNKVRLVAFLKHGGLDSRDQSRSRSKTSFVSRLTFEKCRECPSCQDQLFFFSVEIFKIKTFQSRLFRVEIFSTVKTHSLTTSRSRLSIKTNRDYVETNRDPHAYFSFK